MQQGHSTRREIIGSAGAALALLLPAENRASQEMAAPAWAKRFFNLYTNAAGEAAMRQVPFPEQGDGDTSRLLRHSAARVTIGSISPEFVYDWHVANQPNLLIPIFGTLVVELRDGSRFELIRGDILFAEDCTGSGHLSGATRDGYFGVSVQLDKSFCTAAGDSYLDELLGGSSEKPL